MTNTQHAQAATAYKQDRMGSQHDVEITLETYDLAGTIQKVTTRARSPQDSTRLVTRITFVPMGDK